MKSFKRFILSLCALATITGAHAQTAESTEVDLTPVLFGAVKAKYEQSTITGDHRFNVRNSRIGVKGFASEDIRYAIQIDFNNEGKISILDSYVAYDYGNWEFSLGQQQYHFSRDLDRGPSSNMFSNRSFLSKYLTTYYGSRLEGGASKDFVSSIGSRDIGFLAAYDFADLAPVSFSAGIFNGWGANNPEWSQNINFVSRVQIGRDNGFSGAMSCYIGNTPSNVTVLRDANGDLYEQAASQAIHMYGMELRYANENLLIESEYAQRDLEGDMLYAAHVHSLYRFDMPKSYFINHISPLLRWDIGDGVEFKNMENGAIENYSTNRITVAVNIGLTQKAMHSELRFAYEEYLLNSNHSDKFINPLLQDKYTIEFVAAF